MKTRWAKTVLLACGLLVCAAFLFMACDIDSPEDTIRDVAIIIAGFYAHPTAGSTLVADNTGNPIENMDLRQSGDQLEGIDNNGNIFKGTIGQAGDNQATITLVGMTTAGAEGTIAGTVDVSGSTATMRGTWAEPTLYSTVYGTATVPTNSSGGGTYTLTVDVSPSGSGSVNLNPSGGQYNSGTTVSLTASPASGYTFSSWSGSLSGSANPASLTMNGDKSVTANFISGGP